MFYAVEDILTNFLSATVSYLPNFFGGVLILAIGVVAAQLLRRGLKSVFEFLKLEGTLKNAHLASGKNFVIWRDILIELIGWVVVILFLIPAAEVWGLTRVTEVLNQLLFYLPNVLVAVIVGFVGIIFANLASQVVRHSTNTMGGTSANTLAALARYAIIFFTILIVLDQLGIAQDLIRILFTGIIAMVSIAGGLAFGLGGKDVAKELLEKFKKNVS